MISIMTAMSISFLKYVKSIQGKVRQQFEIGRSTEPNFCAEVFSLAARSSFEKFLVKQRIQ